MTIETRVKQLQLRFLESYGEDLTLDEIERYVNGRIIEAQRKELSVFDSLSAKELYETLSAIANMRPDYDETELIIEEENPEKIVKEEPKKRGRPKKIK